MASLDRHSMRRSLKRWVQRVEVIRVPSGIGSVSWSQSKSDRGTLLTYWVRVAFCQVGGLDFDVEGLRGAQIVVGLRMSCVPRAPAETLILSKRIAVSSM